MELSVLERFLALQLLPEKGDFTTLRTVQEARTNLSLTEEEVKEFELKSEEGRMSWNAKGSEPREIELSKGAIKLISDALIALNEKKELKEGQLSLYEKFVE